MAIDVQVTVKVAADEDGATRSWAKKFTVYELSADELFERAHDFVLAIDGNPELPTEE